jgi:hypothetical protein
LLIALASLLVALPALLVVLIAMVVVTLLVGRGLVLCERWRGCAKRNNGGRRQ